VSPNQAEFFASLLLRLVLEEMVELSCPVKGAGF
jgi:hypothetical protein